MKAPTVVDVAREAGVSTSTAARVLRNSNYPVTVKVRERVKKASLKLGYVPNLPARMLRGAETPYIGVVVGGMEDPYFSQIAEAVTSEARGDPALAIVANMKRDPRLEIEVSKLLWQHRVAGLILSGGGFNQWLLHDEMNELVGNMMKSGVVVASLVERELPVATFSVKNFEVGKLMATTLLELGHTSIGIIMGPPNSTTSQNRLKGARSVFQAAGIKPTEIHADFGLRSGAEAVDRLIEENRGITAILTGGDLLSLGILYRLRELGFSVPGDFSLIGIGAALYARLATPELATVDVSLPACARAAVRYIIAEISGQQSPTPQDFQPTLIRGGSLGPPRSYGRLWKGGS